MTYQFHDNYPYYPLNDNEGYIVKSCNICLVRNKKIVSKWDFNTSVPADNQFKDWFKNLWIDLNKKPFVGREDQWSSEYYSILGNRIIQWCDDRHENSCFIYGAYAIETYITDTDIPDSLKKWLKGNMQHLSGNTSPGPPEHSS
jgi:hypothetical protein